MSSTVGTRPGESRTAALLLAEVERFLKRGILEKIPDDCCFEFTDDADADEEEDEDAEDDEAEDSALTDDNEFIDVSEPDLDSNGGPVDFMSPKNSVANRTASV